MRRDLSFQHLRTNIFLSVATLFFTLLFYVIIPSISYPAEPESSLDEIVVTASRYDEDVANVPANVTVITEEMIRRSTTQNIPDLLRNEAGVQVSDFAGNKRFFMVDLRGFGTNGSLNSLVLVDGRRVNSVDLSGTDWVQLSPDRVQRIEIIRGGKGGVLYGDNASGGVINIITKDGGDKLTAGAEAAGGSYRTYTVNAFAGGPVISTIPFYLSGGYLKSDGYRKNSGLDAKDVGMNFSYLGIKNLKINISGGYHQDNTRMPGALLESDLASGLPRTATTNPNDYANTEDYYVKISPHYFIGPEAEVKIDMSYRHRTSLFYSSGTSSSGAWSSIGDNVTQTISISPSFTIRTDLTADISNKLVFGADQHWSVEDIYDTGPILNGTFKLRKNNYGAYIHDELGIAKKLFISGGYRRDQADYTFSPSNPDSKRLTANAFNGGINLKYWGKSYAYLNFSRSFRYPVLDELFNYYNQTITTSLKAQISDGYEIGTRFYLSDHIFIHADIFRSYTRNEIIFDPIPYANVNLPGLSRRDGGEVSVYAKVIKDLTFRGSYTYIYARIRGGIYDGMQVPNVPKHRAGAEGQFSPFQGFTVILNGNYVGVRRFDGDLPNAFSKQTGYFVMNNKYTYKWKQITVSMNINNITNQKYSDYSSIGFNPVSFNPEKAYYPSPRINLMGGLKIEI